MEPSGAITDLLHRARAGDADALDALMEATYEDLRRLAHGRLSASRGSAILDTTALVNEWYVRFARARGTDVRDRVHFMRYAARVMRSVIVDDARRRLASRRGGDAPHITLTERIAASTVNGEDEIIHVHEALDELKAYNERMATIVEMRYFGGLSEVEIAEALDVSDRTVRREWKKARLWLAEALG